MVIGSKWQLQALHLDDFTISVASDKLFLARQAKYLGLWVRNDLSWDDHILELCRKMYYSFHMFCRLRKILPSALLLNKYKAYVQWKIDYGLSIWGCITEVNLDRVQRIQNLLGRIICNNFDYIHSRGIDLVRSLKLQTVRERRDHFLCVLMLKCIHGLAHHYLSIDVTMLTEFIVLFICTPILYPILMLSFYQFCLQLVRYIHIRNLSQSYHAIVIFMYDLYWWICIYVFLISMYFTL